MTQEARNILSAAGITIGQDFSSLNPDQLAAVRIEAETSYERKHGKPMPADSLSYIRKRYDLLQQRART